MPILNDIMDHKVIGRERKRGIRMGIEQGLERERQFVVKMISKRFRAAAGEEANRDFVRSRAGTDSVTAAGCAKHR